MAVSRKKDVREGHGSSVMNATFSADGHRIVTAGASKSARVFDGADGRFVAELKGHRDTVWDASFSPDRQVVVTASEDQVARIFAAEDGRLVGELRGHSAGVVGARFDRRGRRVVTASRDKTARVWDVAPEDRGPEQLAKLLHAHLPIRFERDGSNVIVPCASD